MRAVLPARKTSPRAITLPALALALALACSLALAAPAQAQSPYLQGLELYRLGRYAEAARILRAALPATTPVQTPTPPPSLTPRLTPPAPLQAQAAQAADPVGADSVGVDSPEAAHTRAMLGFTLLRLDQLTEAEEQFGLVRRSDELRAVGLLGAGWAAFSRGRTSAAVELFAEALSQN
ncbi:MAG: hypothetical protein Q8S17_09460, partial [Humidesulfovibrio sp.]|nr:hypothetical protein [Humidesulfovibrio sp.]